MPIANSTAPTLTDLLFVKAAVGLCLVAPDGTVVRANAEWLRSTGFTEEQVVGENIIELFPATRDMALALHARARAGQRVEVPRHAQPVNGRETWWEGSIEPVPMEGGTGVLIEAREVSSGAPRRDVVIAGIARIFETALSARSEEDLGRACLAIAENVTQSRFGFIGEINPRTGLLDDVAISDPGWEACRIPERTGHGQRKVPIAFAIRGIYGRVLLDGRTVVANDPASHPDSIGTPSGHPPLRAFLGVPLVHGGKTWGMIAVGNRDGGYGPEEQARLEALAPAIVQAFLHKRAEEALRESEARLRNLSDNLPFGAVYRYQHDAQGRPRFVHVSRGIEALTGVAPEEILRDPNALHDTIHPEDRAHLVVEEARSRDGLKPFEMVVRQRHRTSGQERWSLLRSVPSRLPDGTTIWDGVQIDITERIRAEQALRDSDQRSRRHAAEMQAILDAVPAGVFIARDPEARRIDANRAGLEMLRVAAGGNVSKSAPAGEAPAYRVLRRGVEVPPSELPAQRAARGIEVREWDCEVRFGDGTSRHILGYATPLRDDAGRPTGSVTAFVDVTERRRAEDALRASEERFRLGLDAGQMIAWEYDPATKRVTTSDNAKDVLAVRWDRIQEDSDAGYSFIHPGDVGQHRALVTDAIERAGEYVSIYRHVRDGEVLWFEERGRAITDDCGKTVRLVGVTQNITERKHAEVRLRASEQRLGLAFDAARAAAWEVDLVGGKHLWEDRFFPLLCVPPERREWAEQNWTEFVLQEDQARAAEEFARASAEGAGVYDSQFRARRMDGVVRWFRSRGVEVREASGGRKMVGFVQDITDEKESEQKLIEANERLREADRRKDEFLGMLSHELRNPLAPIRNSTYVLRRAQPGSEQARRAQTVIERQTEHLTRLVDDLLDVTRIVRGKIELRRERVDLRDVVSRAGDDFRLLMRDRGIRFDVAVPDEHLWADADATRITQVVGNLLHNASKFTRSGDEVVLSLGASAGDAEIRVRDTGGGIDAALLPRVFDAFVQGERTLARTEGGLGLGLALVKAIADLHGGTVRAESAGKGKGAEFIVRVPLAPAAAAQSAVPGRAPSGSGGRRVLVVDDNRDAAQSLADIIGMLGHDVDVAHDGPSAVAKALAHAPDVVLCDIGLPGMSGYDVARRVRASGVNGMQLFAVSGYAQPEDVKKAIEAGFDGHVAKPCDPEQIERLLS